MKPGTARVVDRVLIIAICAVFCLGLYRLIGYIVFESKKNHVNSDGFRNNVVVDQIDMSQLSYPEALTYWEMQLEPPFRDIAVYLDDGSVVTAGELGASSDYAETLEAAWRSGREGSLEKQYAQLTAKGEEPMVFTTTRSAYDDRKVRAYVDALAEQIDVPPINAGIESFDKMTFKFSFHDSQPGTMLDREKLVQDIEAALDNGGGTVTRSILPCEPETSTEALASEYGMICEARTSASSSSSANRRSNIQLALSMLNGVCVEPGETFSFNKTIGQRTKARGFKEAPAYNSGAVQDEVGGGICQVSTTLMNAVIKADLEIKERHAHSMRVAYVDPGKDATVSWDDLDFKFKNTSSDKIYIGAFINSENLLRIAIFGRLLPNGETITVETKETRKTKYKTEYRVNFSLGAKEMKLVQKGVKGVTVETFKVRHNAKGKELYRQDMFSSTYKPTNEIVECGPR